MPIAIHVDPKNNTKQGVILIYAYCSYFVVFLGLALKPLAPWMLYDVLFSPNVYFFLSNSYFINIIMNTLGGATIIDCPITMIINSFFIGLFPFTNCGPTQWVDGYTKEWLLIFSVAHVIQITVLTLQFFFGARFFLPKWMRTRTYDEYLTYLEPIDINRKHPESCRLCLNLLSEPELEYSDSDKNYKYQRFDRKYYLKTPCLHKFHPNCLLRQVKIQQECPVCDAKLPKDCYSDNVFQMIEF